jgi:hypothetical protein
MKAFLICTSEINLKPFVTSFERFRVNPIEVHGSATGRAFVRIAVDYNRLFFNGTAIAIGADAIIGIAILIVSLLRS